MAKRGKGKSPPKIIIPKKKAGSKSLAGKIRKQQSKIIESLAESVVRTVQKYANLPMLAFYTFEQAASALGVNPDTFRGLVASGIIPEGEKLPCGDSYYLSRHIKALTVAQARFICKDGKETRVDREGLKHFIERYWPQVVYNERKGKWFSRQSDGGEADSVWADNGGNGDAGSTSLCNRSC